MKPDNCRPGPEAGHHGADPSSIVHLQMANFSRLKLMRYLPTYLQRGLSCILIFLIMLVVPMRTEAQVFENAGLENSSTCSLTNCSDEDIDCIDDWWNYTPSNEDQYAWYRYTCESVSSCGDERGIRAVGIPADEIAPATTNPFYGLDRNGIYVVTLDVLTLDITIGGFFVSIYGSNSSTVGTLDLFGVDEIANPFVVSCKESQIGLDLSLDFTHAHITDYPYIVFRLTDQDPRTMEEPAPPIVGIFDNFAACNLLNVTTSNEDCDEVCIDVDIDPACGLSGQQFEDCVDCYFEVEVWADEEIIYTDYIEDFSQSFQWCFAADGHTEFEISYLYNVTIGGRQYYHAELALPYSIGCTNEIVSTNTTWTVNNVPNGGRINELVVESDAILTIESGVEVKFCPGGNMVIEPNAEVRLYGKLTSACDEPWDGVKVYGDNTENQYYDEGNGQYYHGSFRGFPGSVIENAVTSVELFGPDPEDTGGRISCNGTTFKNHVKGVVFGLYANMVGTIPHQYRGSFTNCIFKVDNNYLHGTPFLAHIQMTGVIGVVINGSDFSNNMTLTSPSTLTDFGYGILAKGAGFSVSAISPDYPDECDAPCDRSSFTGLGYGVQVNAADLRNRPFTVNHSDFTSCYVGISVDGVSAGTMIYNKFNMGWVPDPNVMDGDQIGINLRKGIHGFDLEENEFESIDANTNHTMGIVSDFLGSSNNFIRRNVFESMTISNEAFGENGLTGDFVSGLTYLCNENISTDDKDFYIPDETTSGYVQNNVRLVQADYDDLQEIATGNVFASTGNQDDGDFANYGSHDIEYWYDDNDSDQVPDDVVGLPSPEIGNPNACGNQHCIPICPIVIADERTLYSETKATYLHALSQEAWDTAAAAKVIMDVSSLRAVQWYLNDTLTYNEDSLLTWYKRMFTPMGYILGSKLKAAQGDFTSASTFLGLAASAFDLTAVEENDLVDIQDIYDILSVRSIENLTGTDLADLETIRTHPGHASAMARGILSRYGYHFEPEYYIPEEEEFFQIQHPSVVVAPIPQIHVYPNPSDGKVIQVAVPMIFPSVVIDLYDSMGKKLTSRGLFPGINSLIGIPEIRAPGIYLYSISDENGIQSSGVLMITGSDK